MFNHECLKLYHVVKGHGRYYSTLNEITCKKLPKVVIAGSGWAAIHFARQLNHAKFETFIVSPKNFFTFTPLLPFLSSGKILPEACTESLHHIFSDPKPKLIFNEAQDVDFTNKILICHKDDGEYKPMKITYDYLIIAVGAITNTFNIPNVNKYAYFLKDISDSKQIYNKICSNCEYSSYPNLTEKEIEDKCRIMIVGGGPTGVETAACINETIIKSLSKQFPHLKQYLKVYLVESGNTLLATFTPKISNYTLKNFQQDGIIVKLNTRMCRVEADYCEIVDNSTGDKTKLGCGIVIWVSGLAQRPFTRKLINKIPKTGDNPPNSIAVDQYMRVRGVEDVFAIGDCAAMVPDKMEDQVAQVAKLLNNKLSSKRLNAYRKVLLNKYPQMSKLKWLGPYSSTLMSIEEFKKLLACVDSSFRPPFPTAQNAKQEGLYLANVFNQFITSGSFNTYSIDCHNVKGQFIKPFCEAWKGSIAYVGLNKVVFKLPFIDLTGKILLQAFWKIVTIDMLLSCRSKTALLLSWILDRIFGKARTNLQFSKDKQNI